MTKLNEYVVDTSQYNSNQRDPVFYCDGHGHTWVASVKDLHSGYVANIYCNGEMRINFNDGRARYTSDLLDRGIDTDEKLSQIDVEAWDMNPWFDIFMEKINGETDVHMNAVHFDVIAEGVGFAINCIKDALAKYGPIQEVVD
jgi:hypothetical protein